MSNNNIDVSIKGLSLGSSVSTKYKTNILKKNVQNGVNALTQDMITDSNTLYVIKYDYSLYDGIVTRPTITFDSSQVSGVKTAEQVAVDTAQAAYDSNPSVGNLGKLNAAIANLADVGNQSYYYWKEFTIPAHHALHYSADEVRLSNNGSHDSIIQPDANRAIFAPENEDLVVYIGGYAGTFEFRLDNYIVIPSNCTLQFDGGSINDGTILFQNTYIDKISGNKILNVYLCGDRSHNKIINDKIHLSWFKNSGEDCTEILNKLTQIQKFIYCDLNEVLLSSQVLIPWTSIQIKGLPSFWHIWSGNGTTIKPSSDWHLNPRIRKVRQVNEGSGKITLLDVDSLFVVRDNEAYIDIEDICFNGSLTVDWNRADIKVNSGVLSIPPLRGIIHNCSFLKFGGAAINVYHTEHLIIEKNYINWCNCCINIAAMYADFDKYEYYDPDKDIGSAVNDVIIKDNYTGECVIGLRLNTAFGGRVINNYFAHSTFYGVMLISCMDVLFEGNVLENCGGRSFNISKNACSSSDNTLLRTAYIQERRRTYNDFPGFGRKDANGKVWRSQVLIIDSVAHLKANLYSTFIARSVIQTYVDPNDNTKRYDNTITLSNDDSVIGNDCVYTVSGGAVEIEDRTMYGLKYPYFIHYYVDDKNPSAGIQTLKYINKGIGIVRPVLITENNPTDYSHKYSILPNYDTAFGKPTVGTHAEMINRVAPMLEEIDEGFKFFNKNINKICIWNGKRFVDEKGFTPCINRGTTSERPLSIYSLFAGSIGDISSSLGYEGMTMFDSDENIWKVYKIYIRANGIVAGGSFVPESTIKAIDPSVPHSGTTLQRPAGNDIYCGFEYNDTTLNKRVYAKRFVNNNNVLSVEWVERVALPSERVNYLTKEDEGFEYFDITLGQPIYAKFINVNTGVITWVDASGSELE